MNLATSYLGLKLAHPILPGASPLADDLDSVKRLEDAGAAAIVMRSLFEEQVAQESLGAYQHLDGHGDLYAEAQSYFPSTNVFALRADAYLEQLRRIRQSVAVPVIASLNGTTPGGWLDYAKQIEQAGAHALELNLYSLPSSPEHSAHDVERGQLQIIAEVARSVRIPIAVKLSPFYTSLPHFVAEVARTGARGVVLFNRFYQPDIDIETLDNVPQLHLSDSSELLLRLRWLAIVSPRTPLSLACSGGVHSATDAVKALMAGAHAVQVVSALLQHGPGTLRKIVDGVSRWLTEHDYESMDQLIGSMNHARSPNPSAYERANYIRLLSSFHPQD
ncbi:MAG TPA: dihydroorotate dehydrogenase-like protein [Pseudomonadota bacterium]|jgi:dihydroorotate dehydrogenase (fumarate)|nr:dihydroorotate dehydrogenase-like protein [Pseudomonadota bacterium]HNI60936.1 dihydroorotate dehydrogenase-like protein [Pseudomonadota bacterium]HNK44641.1 dihydroorotate dehydrogenase-like protein [Pseudomonadota bacterium]HNN52098.1 dihydroorotate dehydrogenase-like protein [Pseudomonadota bacterium]HNO67034.1 dihydroorotate dehydrogenase-like protein [Pseudomonadota bacterium]